MRLTIALVSFTAALFTSCSTQNPTGQDVDKAFRPLIWPETKVLAGVDIAGLKRTAIYRLHKNDLDTLFDRSGVNRFGIDPRRDLDYLAFSSDGKRSLVFAKGNFKNVKKSELGPAGNAVYFLNDRIALAGDRDSLASARALEQKGTGQVPEELAARLYSLGKNSQIWLVSRGPLPIDNLALRNDTRSNLGNFIPLINGSTIGLSAASGLNLLTRVSSPSPQAATRLHDAFHGLIGLARLNTKDNETGMLKVYDAFQVRRNENIVEIIATLSSSDTDRLLQRIEPRR